MFDKIRKFVDYHRDNFDLFVEDMKAQMNLTEVALGIGILVIISMVVLYITNEVFQIAAITSGSVFYTGVEKIISIINTGYKRFMLKIKGVTARLCPRDVADSGFSPSHGVNHINLSAKAFFDTLHLMITISSLSRGLWELSPRSFWRRWWPGSTGRYIAKQTTHKRVGVQTFYFLISPTHPL